jgi:hypothetical protein
MDDTPSGTTLSSPTHAHDPRPSSRPWFRFARHFAIMLAAMYAGMLTLYPGYSLIAARLGYADPGTELPVLSSVAMAFAMTTPMAIWMRRHQHAWRSVSEMAAAMCIPTLAAALLYLAGTITPESIMSIGHLGMIPAMLALMLYRFDDYARGRHAPEQAPRTVTTRRPAAQPSERSPHGSLPLVDEATNWSPPTTIRSVSRSSHANRGSSHDRRHWPTQSAG